jgi:hypothetical protein
VAVAGTITESPYQVYQVQLFANYENEPQGNVYLGLVNVSTNAAGLANFNFAATPPTGARFITATVTDALQDTSEFSGAVT